MDHASFAAPSRSALGRYLVALPPSRLVLFCYLIWYLTTIVAYFDPTPAIWLNALGLSFVIGVALVLSVRGPGTKLDPWQTFRLFLMPFCVSSFSSSIKGHGFFLFVPPDPRPALVSLAACASFVSIVLAVKCGARTAS